MKTSASCLGIDSFSKNLRLLRQLDQGPSRGPVSSCWLPRRSGQSSPSERRLARPHNTSLRPRKVRHPAGQRRSTRAVSPTISASTLPGQRADRCRRVRKLLRGLFARGDVVIASRSWWRQVSPPTARLACASQMNRAQHAQPCRFDGGMMHRESPSDLVRLTRPGGGGDPPRRGTFADVANQQALEARKNEG